MTPVLLFALIALVGYGSGSWLVRSVSRVRTDQIRRGLFGDTAREGLIRQWIDAVIELAERQVRLDHFRASLRFRAFEGAVAEIGHPHHGHGSTWQFSTGDVWAVDLQRSAPRAARRVIIRSAEHRGSRLVVDAYVPGRIDVRLTILDARLVQSSDVRCPA